MPSEFFFSLISYKIRFREHMLHRAMLLLSIPFAVLFLTLFFRKALSPGLIHHKKLPPGPRGSLLFGNSKDLSSTYLWRRFSSWSSTYGKPEFSNLAYSLTHTSSYSNVGNIIYLNVFGRPIVVLNDFTHARELMEKQSASFSDRPRMIYINKMWVLLS